MQDSTAQEQTTSHVSPIPSNKKKYLYIFASLLFVLMIFLAGFCFGKALAPKQEVSTEAVVEEQDEQKEYKLKGALLLLDGTVERKTNGSWEELAKGATINEGDIIRTNEQSSAVIELDDGSSVRMDENTEISFSALDDEIILITQYMGRVYHRVNPGSLVYNVKSFETLAQALGTSFSVVTDQFEEQTEVLVFENKVSVSSKSDEEVTSDEAEEGEKLTYENETQKLTLAKITTQEQNQEFYKWNGALNEGKDFTYQYQEEKNTQQETKTQQSTQEAPSGTIILTATGKEEGKVYLSWNISGSTSYGFKILKSESANPQYPPREGDHFKYVSQNTYSLTWPDLKTEKTYHFRVGIYNGSGGIVSYSNNVSVSPLSSSTKIYEKETEGSGETSSATSISLSASNDVPGQVHLSWTVSGGDPVNGFKVCKSTDANPTYPENSCIWKDSGTRTLTIKAESGITYHFRVGLYGTSSSVIFYSNDVASTVL